MARKALTMSLLSMFAAACASGASRSGPRTRVGNVPVELYTADDGTPAVEASKPIPAGKMVCTMERPTGSNIAERVCRYQESLDDERRATQETMLTGPKAPPCGPSCPKPGNNAGLP